MSLSHEDDLTDIHLALENRLSQLLPEGEQQELVYAAMRDGTLVAGKRMRPLLLILAARDMGCQQSNDGLLDLACAVEMVHAASLILDDMPCMDNARLRRGRPTIHCQYGEDVAILSAVALLSHAFGVISRIADLSCEMKVQAVAELSVAIGHLGLAQGQFLDLNARHQPRDMRTILRTNELKTSSLFEATLQMAAIAAGASCLVREQLRFFARDMGQAFQLMDDLADGLSTTGKDPDKDRGKTTLVAMIGADAVYLRLNQHLTSADQHIARACQSGTATHQFMHAWFEKHTALLRQSGPHSQPECQ